MKTENGIYLDLTESDYKVKKLGLTFYFSSKFYMEKFKKEVETFTHNEMLKLYNKYRVSSNLKIFLTISFYKRVEKRGFRIYNNIRNQEINRNVVISETIL